MATITTLAMQASPTEADQWLHQPFNRGAGVFAGRITPKGERLASISRFLRTNFLPKHRLLAGEYTDALVDPFVNSPKGPMGYECD